MLQLPQITLLSVSTREVEKAVKALEYSCRDISFGAVKLISNYRPQGTPEYIQWEKIEPFATIDDWNKFMVYELYKYVDTDYCFIVHPDGFIVNPQSWQDKFLDYDYIGSPWDAHCAVAIQGGRNQPLQRVGNSVGIRSKKLLELPAKENLPWRRFNNDSNEDTFISCHNWEFMQQHGITIAPLELAVYFGREGQMPENAHITEPFCFHKWVGRNSQYPRF